MSENVFEKYELVDEPPFEDWIYSPNDVAKKEHILDSLGLSESDIPYLKAVVLHEDEIRIECRIGTKEGKWKIGESYDISELVNNNYFLRKEHQEGDKTYVDFWFEVPDIWEDVIEEF